MTFKVLLTCPPMIRSLERYQHKFDEAGIELVCPEFTQTLSEEALIELLPKFDGWIIGDDPATARVFQAGTSGCLKAAVKWGVGTDNVDFPGAEAVGLHVKNTPGMFGDEVADIVIGYVVGLARQTFQINAGVHAGEWPKPTGISLRDKQAALVGFGNIGRCTAERLLASRMNVNVYDPFAEPDELDRTRMSFLEWPDQIETADYIILTCSLTAQTRHLLDREILDRCRTGVRVVNVSRGPLIDEEALCDALASGKVHSAALEVFETEPLPAAHRLREFPQCLFGSHNASNTTEAVVRTSLLAFELLWEALEAKLASGEAV